jgi:hypothetical protein
MFTGTRSTGSSSSCCEHDFAMSLFLICAWISIDLDAHIKTKVRSGSSVAISAMPGFARPGRAVPPKGWLQARALHTQHHSEGPLR